MLRYFIVHKPYQVLSQFSSEDAKKTLKHFFPVPADVYAVGRLDYDSEGLLLLTNDTQVNHRLLDPKFRHQREYWVQVEGSIDAASIQELRKGVTISVNGKSYRTNECKAEVFLDAPVVAERNPPIRFRKNIPTSWISIVLVEGKNRQVRKMTAAIGYPTLRLIRVRIERLNLDGLQPGEMREISQTETYSKLFGI